MSHVPLMNHIRHTQARAVSEGINGTWLIDMCVCWIWSLIISLMCVWHTQSKSGIREHDLMCVGVCVGYDHWSRHWWISHTHRYPRVCQWYKMKEPSSQWVISHIPMNHVSHIHTGRSGLRRNANGTRLKSHINEPHPIHQLSHVPPPHTGRSGVRGHASGTSHGAASARWRGACLSDSQKKTQLVRDLKVPSTHRFNIIACPSVSTSCVFESCTNNSYDSLIRDFDERSSVSCVDDWLSSWCIRMTHWFWY